MQSLTPGPPTMGKDRGFSGQEKPHQRSLLGKESPHWINCQHVPGPYPGIPNILMPRSLLERNLRPPAQTIHQNLHFNKMSTTHKFFSYMLFPLTQCWWKIT